MLLHTPSILGSSVAISVETHLVKMRAYFEGLRRVSDAELLIARVPRSLTGQGSDLKQGSSEA
jgi:hypothetical protein